MKNLIGNSQLRINKNLIVVDVEENGKRYSKKIPNTFCIKELLSDINKKKYIDYYHEIGGKRRRDTIIEDKIMFVPMAYAFYFYTVNVGQIPSIQTFCNFFLNSFCEKNGNQYQFKKGYSTNDKYLFQKEYLFAKICRAYGSYLREITLLHQLFQLQDTSETYKNFDIFYDVQEDICGGSDIIIHGNGKTIGLLITQKSENADIYNKKKRNYRHQYNYDEYIYVKLNEDPTDEYGDALIFQPIVAEEILQKILKICKN